MMRWFRRHRTQLLAGLVVLLMLSWGISGFVARSTGQPDEVLGRIHGKAVTRADMAAAARTLRLAVLLGFGNPEFGAFLQWVEGNPAAKRAAATLAGQFQQFVFEQGPQIDASAIWRCLVAMREADVEAVVASRAEARGLLELSPVLRDARGFRPERYRQFLRAYELTDAEVTQDVSGLARIAKLIALRQEAVLASRPEVWMRYSQELAQVRLRFVEVDASLFLPLVEPKPDELVRFYAEHKGQVADPDGGVVGYMAPARVKVECALAPMRKLMDQATVTEDEVAAYYEENKYLFRKEQPEGPTDAEQVEPAPEQQHKPLADVEEEIKQTLARRKALDRARDLLGTVAKELDAVAAQYFNEALPLGQMARRHGLDYRVVSVSGGREFLSREELARQVPHGADVAAFAFEEAENLYEPRTFGREDEPLICQVVDRRDPQPQPYEEVKEQVREGYSRKAALESAQTFAEKLRERVAGEGFEGAVAGMEGRLRALTGAAAPGEGGGALLAVQESEMFGRMASRIPGMTETATDVVRKAFGLGPGEVGVAVEGPPAYRCYVLQVIDRREPSGEDFDRQEGQLYRALYLYEKRGRTTRDWLQGLLAAAHRSERLEE